jgi:hypothetical protein
VSAILAHASEGRPTDDEGALVGAKRPQRGVGGDLLHRAEDVVRVVLEVPSVVGGVGGERVRRQRTATVVDTIRIVRLEMRKTTEQCTHVYGGVLTSMSECAAAPRPRFVLFANAELPQLPVQNELASFMSSQIPSNSTPSALQLRSASVHHASVFGANQSGKTV